MSDNTTTSMFKLVEDIMTYEPNNSDVRGGQFDTILIVTTNVCLVGICFNLFGMFYMFGKRVTSTCFFVLMATMALADVVFLGVCTSLCITFIVKG